MILVTGASGHLGHLIIESLQQKGHNSNLGVLVRTPEKGQAYAAKGITVRMGDYHNVQSLETALEGVQTLVLISSSDFNNRLRQHQNVVDAAVKKGVKHLLYTGVSMQGIENSPLRGFLEDHFQTEAYIKASGIPYTFLQHSLYADVIPMFLGEQVLTTGVFFPAGEGRVPFVSRTDLAEAIAHILTSQGHENQTYPLTNNRTYSFAEVAQYLSKLSGKEVGYISPTPETYTEALRSINLPEHIIQLSVAFALGMAHQDFNQSYPFLEQFLQRKPQELKDFLKKAYAL